MVPFAEAAMRSLTLEGLTASVTQDICLSLALRECSSRARVCARRASCFAGRCLDVDVHDRASPNRTTHCKHVIGGDACRRQAIWYGDARRSVAHAFEQHRLVYANLALRDHALESS